MEGVNKAMIDIMSKALEGIQKVLEDHNEQLMKLWLAVEELERRTHGQV